MPTEAKEIFEANSRSVGELLSLNGLGMYIPAYQRPYGWDKGKVVKLLDDTLHGIAVLVDTEDSFTFLGSIITIHDTKNTTVHPIVKEMVPGRVLTVIDGQQRLCSLILLCVALHGQIVVKQYEIFKGGQSSDDEAESWLYEQTLIKLQALSNTFCEVQATGESPIYPRIIRAFTDQWSRRSAQARYQSPIANLITAYVAHRDLPGKPKEFRPKAREGGDNTATSELAGETALTRRFTEIQRYLVRLAANDEIEELESLPELAVLAYAGSLQKALFNHELSDEVRAQLLQPSTQAFIELFRLLVLASYVLNRIALTVVQGKNEDYAFTIFESLNTTGEPLTAFETFKPRVVSAEGLENYGDSAARANVEVVEKYLGKFGVGTNLQNATRDLLVYFAAAETGEKLPKRLTDQRAYLRREFDRHVDNPAQRLAFLESLRDITRFVEEAWSPDSAVGPRLPALPAHSTTDRSRLCLAFLRKLNHSVAIGPLTRFYSVAQKASASDRDAKVREFDGALSALTAFSVLWRASKRTTANIDREYRQMMAGIEQKVLPGPLARQCQKDMNGTPCVPDVAELKEELRQRLADPDRGGIDGRDEWINLAKALPMYAINTQLSRFLLLAAYDDSVPDGDTGLIIRGRSGVSECLNYSSFEDERYLTLEHVAPSHLSPKWSSDLYSDKEVVDRLGNLVLAQPVINSSLSDRRWEEKRVLYLALSAQTPDDTVRILESSANNGITFAESTESLVGEARFMPHLAAVGQRAGDWDVDFINERSVRLLGAAWDRLWPWLND